MAESPIGKVIHWYDKLSVAVVKLSKALKVGDRVKVVHGSDEFTDTVSSMQFDHQVIAGAKKGQEVAVKLSRKAGEGSQIFLAE